jgi:putative ABC transport system permease protein
MKYLHLIWRNLMRKKARTLLTTLMVAVAFILFAFLAAIRLAFSMGVELTGLDRLVMIHKVSIIQPLPFSYLERLKQIDGVVDATHATWFGGIYQDRRNFFPQMPVDPEAYLRLYPEFILSEEEKQAWLEDRAGAIVGRRTAERFGWKIGDRIPLDSPIWHGTAGTRTWEFNIRGIYEGAEPGVDETNFYFHYEFFNEGRAWGDGLVGWYILRIDDPDRAVEIADRIDASFANSRYETETTTEKAFLQAWADQIGNVGAILTAVLTVVFFTILLVAGNTMAQAVRERTSELAVLKTLGFSSAAVLGLVLAESLLLNCLGGWIGLLLGWMFVGAVDPLLQGMVTVFFVPAKDFAIGVGLAILLGVACGVPPALQAMRLQIVDGLRRV